MNENFWLPPSLSRDDLCPMVAWGLLSAVEGYCHQETPQEVPCRDITLRNWGFGPHLYRHKKLSDQCILSIQRLFFSISMYWELSLNLAFCWALGIQEFHGHSSCLYFFYHLAEGKNKLNKPIPWRLRLAWYGKYVVLGMHNRHT